LWEPAFFGTKPDKVLKGGIITWSQMGDANASIPTPQPVWGREMFGARSGAIGSTCCVFLSRAAMQNNLANEYGLRKRAVAVQNCRSIGKRDMKLNDALPLVNVDPETYEVSIDGVACAMQPAKTVCMATGMHLF
jgi:urease subunit alpha